MPAHPQPSETPQLWGRALQQRPCLEVVEFWGHSPAKVPQPLLLLSRLQQSGVSTRLHICPGNRLGLSRLARRTGVWCGSLCPLAPLT